MNNLLKYNPILATDSYKMSHAFAYPDDVTGMFSYIEARTGGKDIIVPFGLQMFLKKYFTIPITVEDIDEAELFTKMHGEPFNRAKWEYILTEYNGFFPITIKSVPEGLPVRSGHAIVTIECNDPEVFWLSSYLETMIQRAIWYPTSICSMDYAIKQDIKQYYERTGADMLMLPFTLNDFGARGVTCHEQAEIGGAAHLVNFMGSDNMEGIRAVNFYYTHDMAGFSEKASEHSVECSFGKEPEQELEYLRHMLSLGKPGEIVSIVIDGYDVYRAAETLCTTMKDEIIASGVKVVFRPDSGDMMITVPRLLDLQAATFGYDINEKGYKKIKYVGIIQGDGVDGNAIRSLLGKMAVLGYASDNVVFGSGGALLQKVNRDTYKFAQKASAVRRNGEWIGCAKDPITDPGKKSKEGRVTLVRSKITGEMMTLTTNDDNINDEFENVMVVVYDHGKLFNETTLAEIRARCAI